MACNNSDNNDIILQLRSLSDKNAPSPTHHLQSLRRYYFIYICKLFTNYLNPKAYFLCIKYNIGYYTLKLYIDLNIHTTIII